MTASFPGQLTEMAAQVWVGPVLPELGHFSLQRPEPMVLILVWSKQPGALYSKLAFLRILKILLCESILKNKDV